MITFMKPWRAYFPATLLLATSTAAKYPYMDRQSTIQRYQHYPCTVLCRTELSNAVEFMFRMCVSERTSYLCHVLGESEGMFWQTGGGGGQAGAWYCLLHVF